MRVTALAKFIATGFIASKGAASPPHITVSAPFTAPAWPPETGASMKCRPWARACACSSRATSADAVVWSTKMAPAAMPAKAPSGPGDGAQVGVVAHAGKHEFGARGGLARRGAVLPPYSAAQAAALAGVRL
jgi:hypothetical protein